MTHLPFDPTPLALARYYANLSPGPGAIDHDPEGQEAAIRRIVDILYADTRAHSSPFSRDDVRRTIRQALGSYRASVTQTVFDGVLTVDQGADLMRMVDKIAAEEV